MQFLIEEAGAASDLDAVRDLENRVFRGEKGIYLKPLAPAPENGIFRLLARNASTGEPAGALSVIESNSSCPVFRRHVARVAGRGGRAARFTRLAVLPEYRGQSLSMRMILEAQRRFVAPENIRHTWLLFDAARAANSLLCTLLGFDCGSSVIRSEYGPCRLLARDELSITAQSGNRRGWAYLAALAASDVAPDMEYLFPHYCHANNARAMPFPPAA